MQPGAILLSAISGLLFFAVLLGIKWALRRLRQWSRDVDEARERRLEELRRSGRDDDA